MAETLQDFFSNNPQFIVYNSPDSIEKEVIYYIKNVIKDSPTKWELQALTYFFQKFNIPAKRANYNLYDKDLIASLKESGDLIWDGGSFILPQDIYKRFEDIDYRGSLEKQLILNRTKDEVEQIARDHGWPRLLKRRALIPGLFPKSKYGPVLSVLYNFVYKNFIYPEHDAYTFVDEYYGEY